MIVRQHPGATLDLDEALGFYARISGALVDLLLADVAAAKRRIVEFPDAWHPLGARLRRYRLRRFPYVVIFRPGHDEILIVAYAHMRRRPAYWRTRLQVDR